MNDSESKSAQVPLVNLPAPNQTKPSGVGTNDSTKPIVSKTDTPVGSALTNQMRSELVRKNWKTVLDVAMNKRKFDNLNDNIESTTINLNNANNMSLNYTRQNMFADEKFNWIFFAIIISFLIILSILFCSLVYAFFPQFRV